MGGAPARLSRFEFNVYIYKYICVENIIAQSQCHRPDFERSFLHLSPKVQILLMPSRNWAAPHLALQPPRTLCIPLPPPMLTGLHTILAVSCARAGLRAMSDASGPVRECRRARFEDTLRSTSQAEEDTAEKWRGRTHAPCCDSCSDVRGASPPHRRTPRQLDVFVYLSLMNRIFLLIHQCMNGICFLIIPRRI